MKPLCMRAAPNPYLLASMSVHYDRFISVKVHEGGIEEGLVGAGFKVLKGCIH